MTVCMAHGSFPGDKAVLLIDKTLLKGKSTSMSVAVECFEGGEIDVMNILSMSCYFSYH